MPQMNMQKMMQQARKMQEQLAAAQDNLKDIEVEASAGGGMVKVVATGDMKLKSITIDPDAVDPEDVDMLQDMVLAAANEALRGAEQKGSDSMSSITSGLNIPGMPGLF